MITFTISVTYIVLHNYLYFKLDLVQYAKYLGHLSNRIFTLSMPFCLFPLLLIFYVR